MLFLLTFSLEIKEELFFKQTFVEPNIIVMFGKIKICLSLMSTNIAATKRLFTSYQLNSRKKTNKSFVYQIDWYQSSGSTYNQKIYKKNLQLIRENLGIEMNWS